MAEEQIPESVMKLDDRFAAWAKETESAGASGAAFQAAYEERQKLLAGFAKVLAGVGVDLAAMTAAAREAAEKDAAETRRQAPEEG